MSILNAADSACASSPRSPLIEPPLLPIEAIEQRLPRLKRPPSTRSASEALDAKIGLPRIGAEHERIVAGAEVAAQKAGRFRRPIVRRVRHDHMKRHRRLGRPQLRDDRGVMRMIGAPGGGAIGHRHRIGRLAADQAAIDRGVVAANRVMHPRRMANLSACCAMRGRPS